MKRRVLLLFILAALLLNFGCSQSTNHKKDSSDTGIQTTETSKSINIDEISYSDKAEFSAGGKSEISISAPVIVSEVYSDNAALLNKHIEDIVDSFKNDYLKDVEKNKNSEGADSSSRNLEYDVKFADDGLVSILLKTTVYNYIGGHPSYAYTSINYDLATGTELKLDDFADVKIVKAKVLSKMRENSERYLSTEDNCFSEEYIYESFLFDDDKLYIYFDDGMITPIIEGVQTFSFSYSELS